MVGLSVLFALVALGWMILKFGGKVATPFAPEQYRVSFVTDRADGLADGSPISYRGVDVGRVTRVQLSADQRQVQVTALLNKVPELPANVRGIIRQQSLLGTGAGISLELTSPTPEGTLAANAELVARFAGIDLLPPEFSQLAGELRSIIEQVREAGLIDNVNKQVTAAGELMQSIQKLAASSQELIDDPKLREDIRKSVAGLREATEAANRITSNLETFTQKMDKLTGETSEAIAQARGTIGKTESEILSLSRQMSGRLEQVATLLDQINSITSRIDKGQGTAGALINDPRLYESLVDTTRELNATIKDLKRLVQQWEQEGVQLKLR